MPDRFHLNTECSRMLSSFTKRYPFRSEDDKAHRCYYSPEEERHALLMISMDVILRPARGQATLRPTCLFQVSFCLYHTDVKLERMRGVLT